MNKRLKIHTQLRLCIPQLLRKQLLKEIHDGVMGAHPGENHMYTKMSEQMWWPRMMTDIKHYIDTCQICQQAKKTKTFVPPMPMSLPFGPWSCE